LESTANLFDLDVSRLNPADDDPSLHNYNNKSPNIGAGLYLHSDKAYVLIRSQFFRNQSL
jgi:hypothetical protein